MVRRRFLVAYDIRDPKRLREVHSGMKRFGYPLQYSVFICDLDAIEKLGLREVIGARMNQKVDSLVLVDLGDPSTRGIDCFEFMGVAPSLPRAGPTIA